MADRIVVVDDDVMSLKLAERVFRRAGVEGSYSLGLWVDFGKGNMGHGGAWKTSCHVNWRQKTLRLWVVQQNGRPGAWAKAWSKAAEKFFAAASDTAGDAYTGRLK